MENKIRILGIMVDNYLTLESKSLIDEYLEQDCMNTISVIQIPTLLRAVDDDEFKEYIEQMDLTVAGDAEILEAAGLEDKQKLSEASDGEFLIQFFQNVVKKEKTIFILGEKEQEVDRYMKAITKRHTGLNIAGKFAIDGYEDDWDSIVNELNSVAPDVIISILPSPFQEKFVIANKNKISARVWIGVGDELQMSDSKTKSGWLKRLIEKKLLLSKVKKYESENGD
ncbi:WecB/TagA/CpsF family glycosyltransferase [Konateibacter massiliensis]|uniref:WecB/TagA/CpsF family glycosyltransferase n=1 Tax=Konateibacter massiliensis TaxID=2002841 RepID=UPI000C152C8D|nr:WecB/TagA/CpsF family glycosyltransferase [Konateibacter massiliensis]